MQTRYNTHNNKNHLFYKNRQINDNLEQQTQALFKSWFVDFEPFRGGKFVDSELGNKVRNPSALPWERNNFNGAFEVKSENGNFGIRIEVQRGRNNPF